MHGSSPKISSNYMQGVVSDTTVDLCVGNRPAVVSTMGGFCDSPLVANDDWLIE